MQEGIPDLQAMNLSKPMQTKQTLIQFLTAALTATILTSTGAAQIEPGFTSLFDGSTLKGWTSVGKAGPGYVPKDGVLVCPADGGGNLYTEKEYENFIFRFDFKLSQNANNGIGIRAPLHPLGLRCSSSP